MTTPVSRTDRGRRAATIRAVKLVALIAACGGVALAGPAVARADTYCVGDPGGACDVSKAATGEGLQLALDEAAASAASDVVRIGAGTFVGSFGYASASEVDIEGSGESTVIRGVGTQAALTVAGSGSAPTLSGLTIQMATLLAPQTAVGLRIGPGIAEDLRVENPGDSWGTGVVLQPGGDVADSTILAGGADGIDEAGGASQREVRDTVIHAALGVRARTGSWSLERLEISGRSGGVASYATTHLSNSLVRVSGAAASPVAAFGVLQGGPGTLDVDHATIHAGADLEFGAWVKTQEPGTASIDMTNSIVAGPFVSSTFARTATPGGTANIVVGYSNFVPPSPQWVGAGAGPGSFTNAPSASNNAMEPKFVDPLITLGSPGADFRLRHDSPLIDRGAPGGAQGKDLAGQPRLVEGDGKGDPVHDMGAYEYQHRPPGPQIAAPLGGHVQAGTPVAFSAAGSRDVDAGDTLSYEWSFGDGAGATGETASHAYESGGERTVTLTVTDSTGLKGIATVTLVVDAAPAPANPGTSPGPDTSDRVAPVLSAASLSATTFRAGRRGTRVRFSLSEAATVRFAIVRRSTGRRVAAFTRQAPAGASTVRFRGKLRVGGRIRALTPGRYRLTLVAKDATGNVSAPRRLGFRVVQKRTPPAVRARWGEGDGR
jgi:PKD domain